MGETENTQVSYKSAELVQEFEPMPNCSDLPDISMDDILFKLPVIKGKIYGLTNAFKILALQSKIYLECIGNIITHSRKKPRKLNRLYRQLKRLQKEYNNDSTRND